MRTRHTLSKIDAEFRPEDALGMLTLQDLHTLRTTAYRVHRLSGNTTVLKWWILIGPRGGVLWVMETGPRFGDLAIIRPSPSSPRIDVAYDVADFVRFGHTAPAAPLPSPPF